MTTTPLGLYEELVTDRLSQAWQRHFAHAELAYGSLGVCTGTELVACIQGAGEERRDEVLHELLRLCTAERHDAALRVLLHSFTPLIHTFARRLGGNFNVGGSHKEATNINAATAVLWEVVSNFPLHHTQHLAGNIRGEMNKIISREFTSAYKSEVAIGDPQDLAMGSLAIEREHGGAAFESLSLNMSADALTELMRVLEWAIDGAVLKEVSAKLLGAYTVATRPERHAMAEGLGISPTQLSKRVSGYAERLATAVRRAGLCREGL